MAATRTENHMNVHHRYGTVARARYGTRYDRLFVEGFYGLLAWANLNAHTILQVQSNGKVTRHSESFKIFREMVP
jgi:hypothetical protein